MINLKIAQRITRNEKWQLRMHRPGLISQNQSSTMFFT